MKSPLRTGFLGLRSQWKPGGAIARLVALTTAALLLTAGTAMALPADRAYEMVSPPDTRGQDVGAGGFGGAYRASPGGDALLYQALGGWGDAPANALSGVYLARRGGESWTNTSALLPGYPKSLGATGVYGVSDDLRKVISLTDMNLETGEQSANYLGDMYLLDPVTKERERLTPDSLLPIVVQNSPGSADRYEGNADYSVVVFESTMALTEDSTGLSSAAAKVYRYADGEVSLESRLPNGTLSSGGLSIFSTTATGHQPLNRVSHDGDVFFFTVGGSTNRQLYRRDFSDTPASTVLVNASENTLEVVPAGHAEMAGASADGEVVFFASPQRLVDEDTDATADIYRYDHSQPAGSRLTLISVDSEPGDAGSATGSSYGVGNDGKSVVFTSNSQLVEGETTDPGPKLFAWHDGGLRFIGLTGSAVSTLNTTWSQNGKYFGFTANGSSITPEDNGGTLQAYRYAVETDELECVSCLRSGANTTPATWRRDQSAGLIRPSRQPIRNIANDGEVFFQTADSLVGDDTNGKIDVYIWSEENGAELISSGRSTDDSWMMDASVDGSTVFFMTRSRLSAWDGDDLLDAYAARVGDGLPEPPETPAPCAGADCLGQPSAQPTFSAPQTSENHSAGNPKAEKSFGDCRKLDRKAKRLQRKAKRTAEQLRSANGKKAKRQAKRKAKKTKQQAKRSAKRAERCNQGAGR